MKLTANKVEGFLETLTAADLNGKIMLLYGGDQGAVTETTKQLTSLYLGTEYDPLQNIFIEESQLKQTPSLIMDEANSISMFGDKRLLCLRCQNATGVDKYVLPYLTSPASKTLLLIEAASLSPQNKLRKAIENATSGIALPFFSLQAASLDGFIRRFLAQEGYRIESVTCQFLRSLLPGDRGIITRELERLVLYMGVRTDKTMEAQNETSLINLDHIIAAMTDQTESTIFQLADAVSLGNIQSADKNLRQLANAGTDLNSTLIALRQHFHNLHLAVGQIEQGYPVAEALKSFRPPIHFQRRAAIEKQVRLWSRAKIEGALSILQETEAALRQQYVPDTIIAYNLLRLSRAAQRAR